MLVANVQEKIVLLRYYYHAPIMSCALTFLQIFSSFSFPFVKGYEYVGFLWRKHRPGLPELTMSGGELFNDKYINFTRKPFIGHFQVRYTSIRFKVCILCIIGEWLEIYCGECAPES